jgi:hypothetical protein
MERMITFYSLLYFSKSEKIPNLSRLLHWNKDSIYVNMASNLSNQLHKLGYKHILITNKKKILESYNYKFPVIELNFKKRIKKETRFYSAHFKIDIFKYFSKQQNKSCLIDLDIFIINKFNNYFKNLANNYNLLYSLENGADYGKKYYSEINKIFNIIINKKFKKPKWYGGEFILGNKLFFKKLYKEIDILYPKYIKNINHFFHIGDETLLNCAIQKLLLKNNFFFKDIKGKKIIYRHWSIIKNSKFKLEYALKNIFLHAPGDKFFISRLNFNYLNFNLIKHKYSNHHNSIIRAVLLFLINKMKKLFI